MNMLADRQATYLRVPASRDKHWLDQSEGADHMGVTPQHVDQLPLSQAPHLEGKADDVQYCTVVQSYLHSLISRPCYQQPTGHIKHSNLPTI